MSLVVLDASAAVELVLRTTTGVRVGVELRKAKFSAVPEHFFVEVASALRRVQIAGEAPPERVEQALGRLLGLPVRSYGVRPLVREAWALRHNVTLQDAVYVVLARRLGATLATTDARLARASPLGVELLDLTP